MKIVLSTLIMIALFSCGKKEEVKQETPKALQEGTTIAKYSGRDGNLVENIYQEIVSNSPELQKMETEIEQFDSSKIQDDFRDYNRKSVDYYSSATDYAKSISDSVTKNKMLEIIKKSNASYLQKSNEYEKLSKIITGKNKSIRDTHSVLKILLSMQVIEKYQNENGPDKKDFLNVIKKQDSLIRGIQKKFPK